MEQMCTLLLPDGTLVPRIGQGTWQMGELPEKRSEELESLRWGIAHGMNLLDTAEMYGDGRSEQLVGEAIRGFDREQLFLVSKVCPQNAYGSKIIASCENSLRRLGTDYLDLYLLHWPSAAVPYADTVAAMEQLVRSGKIRRWGVSNFEVADMEALMALPGGEHCAVNQVMYHLGSRGVEFDLLPWLQAHHIPLMAYCPIAQAGALRGELLASTEVQQVAAAHGITPVQVLLAFLMAQPGVLAIPKAGSLRHVQANRAAADVVLTNAELALLRGRFPAPDHWTELDML